MRIAGGGGAESGDVTGIDVVVEAEGEEPVDVEALLEVGGEDAGRVSVDLGPAVVDVGGGRGVVVIKEDTGGEMGGDAEGDSGIGVTGGVLGLGAVVLVL